MTLTQQILTIGTMVVATASTRFLPFLIFSGRKTPSYIHYLSNVLPPAVFGMLVVYCLKDVQFLSAPFGLPEIIGIVTTIVLHVWKRQMLLSIGGGTAVYMVLVQTVFA